MVDFAQTEVSSSIEVDAELYRSLIGSMPLGTAYCRMLFEDGEPKDFVYMMANDAFIRETGLEDIVGKRNSQVIPGILDKSPELIERCAHVATSGQPTQFEVFSQLLQRWYRVSAFSPKPEHFVAMLEDISERKAAENALQASEKRFRQLAKSMPQLVWTADPDGKVDYYNERRHEYSGLKHTDSGDYEWAPVLHPDDVEHTVKAWQHAVETGNAYQAEHRVRLEDGSFRWHISRGFPTYDAQGKIVKWSGTATDVHELKQAQEALSESEERFRTLFDNAADGIFIADSHGRYVAVNARGAEMLGYARGEILQRAIPDVVAEHEKARFPLHFQDLRSKDCQISEWIFLRKDGSNFIGEVNSQVLRDGSLIGIVRDISERKETEERERFLSNLYRAVSATNEAIMLSHSEAVLFPIICQIATEYGGMSLVWIGIPDASGKFVPVAHDGIASMAYMESLTVLADSGLPEGRGPVGITYREGAPTIINDIESSEIMTPWKGKAASQGVRSMATFPIYRDNRVYGVFILASAEKDAFDEEIVQLLAGMTNNISFALHNFDREKERTKSETALRESEARFRQLADAMPHLVWIARTDGFIEYFNSRCYEYAGYEKGSIENENKIWPSLIHPDDYDRVINGLKLFGQKKAEILYDEYRILGHDGTYRWFMERTVPIVNDSGEIVRWFGSCTDIHEKKQAEEQLIESEGKFRALVESAGDSYLVHDFHGRIIEVNKMTCEIHGYTRDELLGMTTSDLNKEIKLAELQRIWLHAQGNQVMSKSSQHWTKSGKVFPVAVRVSSIMINGQRLFLSLIRDVSEQQKAEEALKLAAMVYQDSSEAMMVANSNGRIMAVNPAFEKITGFPAHDVIGKYAKAFFSTVQDEIKSMDRSLRNKGQWKGEIWSTRKNGQEFAISLTINTSYNSDDAVDKRVYLFSDITERKQSDEIIWNQANFDALTGLPNRRFFRDRLTHEIRSARRSGLPMALMFLDLDGFKYVNDTLGHDMGDVLLREAANRLFACVRDTDTVARLGGDEFTVILPELQDVGNIERIARHILRVLAEPIRLGEELAYVSASIGITLYPQDASDAEELIRNADQAMYAAKEAGKNRFHYFTPAMQEEAIRRMRLINDMRGALEANQFEIVYQPIIELSTGAIHKAEALIRWQHPTKGLVHPIDFISAAEDTGMITSFGNWIFREAAKQASVWRERHHPAFQISVNISPVQFKNEGIDPTVWFDHLRSLGLPGQGVVVEITEGLLLEANPKVTDQLLMLRDAGIEVALDDFGTGYSSLSYLKKFDIDYVKIDQTFVSNLAPGSDDMALSEAIIVMAHRLGIRVIAEGVETKRQHELLANAGCDFAQGYLFSKPVSAKEFEVLLATNPFAAQESLKI